MGTRSVASASMASTILPSMVGTTHGVGDAFVARAVAIQSSAEKRTPGSGTMRRPDVGGAQHRGDARDVERRHDHDRGFVLTRATRTRAC